MDEFTYSRAGNIAVATVASPPINALTLNVRKGLLDALERAATDPDIVALVVIGGGKTFVSGADIRDFGKPYVEPTLYTVIDALAASAKPVIAAIHGHALGGGLELAFSCHSRVAIASAKVGQPEVKLGLMPGGRGTQWWTRLAGPRAALDVCTGGNPVGAVKAHELGVIDRIIEGDLLAGALIFAREVAAGDMPNRHLAEETDKTRAVDPQLFADFRKKNARKWRGLVAPWRIVDCIEAACNLGFSEGCALEKAAFAECERSPQSKALIHLFFAEREVGKIAGAADEAKPREVRSVAVIGAGTMGCGIAMAFANAAKPVTLVEVSDEALARGLGMIQENYATSVSRGSITQLSADSALALIHGSTRYEDIAPADLMIEAVFEDMAIKQAVFRRIAAVAKLDALLATNTSMLDIDQIAAVVPQPERVLGLHFFSPANVMKLIEVVRGARTSAQSLATALGVARTLRKIAVVAGNAEGFIGNRIMAAYGREADILLEQGATPWQIDRVLLDFGCAMGLYAVRDLAGLDVIWRVRQMQAVRHPTDLIADRIHALGRYGQKTAAGYYLYDGRTARPDSLIEALIAAVAIEHGIARRKIDDAEILERILGAMAAEGEKLLAEGIAQRAGDIDIVYVHGYGFPAWHGGPMFRAQQQTNQEETKYA
jgi:3-hydroxyacyl-CoA dehydrogenase